jgi:acyl-homoserine lactone acylase PvdQ
VIRTHSCAEQVSIALVQAYGALTAVLGPPPAGWRWGRFHTMQPVSQLALVTGGYQPGPFARPGGAFTVDVGSPSLSDKGLSFGYASGGNVRHISVMDPTNPVIKMQLPGPERDGPAGIFTGGPDLLRDWVQNKYFDFAHGTQVAPLAVAAQTFNPP